MRVRITYTVDIEPFILIAGELICITSVLEHNNYTKHYAHVAGSSGVVEQYEVYTDEVIMEVIGEPL